MLFVLNNVSLPFVNISVSAFPDFLGDLVDQSEIVRNEHHATVEGFDRVGQGVDGFDIQVVCRFVEKEEVTVLPSQPGESDATLE